jgi:TetR/AcrR family transcriptional regulator, transcriptional repressor for nem operon
VSRIRLFHVDEQRRGAMKLKQFIANFVERKPPIAGGCPILNTAVEADDGNPVLRAKVVKALRTWTAQLESFVEQGKAEQEIRSDVDSKAVATVLIASLEGALMLSKVQRSEEPMRLVHSHLNAYLETAVFCR